MPTPIKREDLKVGMIVTCGDEKHAASTCWTKNSKAVPFKITRPANNGGARETLDGQPADSPRNWCNCSDLNHLYLYEPMISLENMPVGMNFSNEAIFWAIMAFQIWLSTVLKPAYNKSKFALISFLYVISIIFMFSALLS